MWFLPLKCDPEKGLSPGVSPSRRPLRRVVFRQLEEERNRRRPSPGFLLIHSRERRALGLRVRLDEIIIW